jgi:hypothetical protein
MGKDDDLVYVGRERKRPPGASALVQRIYGLLYDRPEGMTRDEIWEELREGWLETDAYRAYHQHRLSSSPRVEYGSPAYRERAQKWWIAQSLAHMKHRGSARREGDRGDSRWFAARPPRIVTDHGYSSLDVPAQRAAHRASTQAHLRREHVKGQLLEGLNDRRTSKERLRELVQLAFDHLSGR